MASLVAQTVKNLPAMQMWIWFLVQESPLEKEMTTCSSILDWRIPWTEEPGRLQSMGLQRVGHNWSTNTVHLANLSRGIISDTCSLRIDIPFLCTSNPLRLLLLDNTAELVARAWVLKSLRWFFVILGALSGQWVVGMPANAYQG